MNICEPRQHVRNPEPAQHPSATGPVYSGPTTPLAAEQPKFESLTRFRSSLIAGRPPRGHPSGNLVEEIEHYGDVVLALLIRRRRYECRDAFAVPSRVSAVVSPGVSSRWIDAGITEEEAERYMDELFGDERCSRCGKRADYVDALIRQPDGTYFCDACSPEPLPNGR